MLEQTFLHIAGVGNGTERRFWSEGTVSMESFLASPPAYLSEYRAGRISQEIREARSSIVTGDPQYFARRLKPADHWRMFREFRGSTAYVDIETTGLGSPEDIITTIALYDGEDLFTYVNGENLEDFIKDISGYGLLVTYNGKTFDVPFIERYLGITLDISHIDLRYVLHGLGFRGGLKCCEMRLGAGRTGPLAQVDGYMAVLMWREYRRTGNRRALETLLHYNAADTVNLEFLMVEAYNRKIGELPIPVDPLHHGSPPEIPFIIDENFVERIRWEKYGWS